MSTDTNDPATQARIAEALGALAAAVARFEAAGTPPAEVAAALLLIAAHTADTAGVNAEQFEDLARLAWGEARVSAVGPTLGELARLARVEMPRAWGAR